MLNANVLLSLCSEAYLVHGAALADGEVHSVGIQPHPCQVKDHQQAIEGLQTWSKHAGV